MPLTHLVIAQSNPATAQRLADSLRQRAASVTVARPGEDLRATIAWARAGVVVLDLELFPLECVEQLRREFPDVCVVCTHRLADERLWVSAMNAGADDCCLASDLHAIVTATHRGTLAGAQAA